MVEQVVLVFVVENGYYVVETVVEQTHNVFDILGALVAVADDEGLLVN